MEEFEIVALGRQGDGIAKGPVFVPRALPGETVSGKRNGDLVEDVKVLEPSSQRIKPVCRHFKSCGGCQMQHASDELLADWKRGIVEMALKSQGLETVIGQTDTSPPRSRRRAKIAAKRSKSGALAGFHARASDTVVDVQDCPLVTPIVSRGFELSRDLAVAGGSRKAVLSVQCTEVADGLDVDVEGGKPLDRDLQGKLPQIAVAHGVVRLTWNDELVAQSAPPVHKIGRADVILPPGAFLQATDHGETTLQSAVLDAVSGATQLADLFSGCGTFALKLAEQAPVVAVEGDKAMTRALQEAANHAGLAYPIKAVTRDLFDDPLVTAELSKFDAVVLDPPRAGAAAQVQELAKSQVPVIGYVSCDQVTFARDAAVLVKGGYRLDWVRVVDQFRWSPHVELAARFSHVHMKA